MRTGTSHFISRYAAEQYYRPYGYQNLKEAVQNKLDTGEICIGRPDTKPGEHTEIDTDGRYWIADDQ
jgi:hypothetical protein